MKPLLSSAAVIAFCLTACSSGPRPPQPGTPAFFWAAAKETFRTGDYLKTNDNLQQLTRTQNEFTARATPWEVIVSSGLAQGYMELANACDDGARMNRANPTPFRRNSATYRSLASAAWLQNAEAVHRFESGKEPNVPLEFAFPSGSVAYPLELSRVSKGILVPAAEMEAAESAMLRRGVVKSVTRFVGAEEDSAKAIEIFKKPEVQVSRPVFLLAAAAGLHDGGQLFGPTKLDQPNRAKMLYSQALEAVGLAPESAASKKLTNKIQSTMKKSKIM